MHAFLAWTIATTVSAAPHPICTSDFSTVPLSPMGLLEPPARLGEGAVRPGLLHVQAEVCRCLPRRRSHQPEDVLAQLHIAPNDGVVRVAYTFAPPDAPPRVVDRLQRCLGGSTLRVEPMAYRSDMIVDGEPVDEELMYPLRLVLTE